MRGDFYGEISLACGHQWRGRTTTQAEAETFLATCIATGDTVVCATCAVPVKITGPLYELIPDGHHDPNGEPNPGLIRRPVQASANDGPSREGETDA